MNKAINYRQLNRELEEILDKLQAGNLDIDEAFKQYERGMQIAKQLKNYLKQTENKITKIKQSAQK